MGRFINADEFTSTGQGLLGYNMYAYCRNNPINYVDANGNASIWYYLIEACKMGLIHFWVQTQIVESNVNISMELWLYKDDRLVGRADIMRDSSVWEIKHGGSNPEDVAARIQIATAQAESYVGGRTARDGRIVQKLGSAGAFAGSFTINVAGSTYEVTYDTPASGVILYYVKEVKPQENSEYVFEPATQQKTLPASVPNTMQAMMPVLMFGGAMAVMCCMMDCVSLNQQSRR